MELADYGGICLVCEFLIIRNIWKYFQEVTECLEGNETDDKLSWVGASIRNTRLGIRDSH